MLDTVLRKITFGFVESAPHLHFLGIHSSIIISAKVFGLDDRGFMILFPVGAGKFSLYHRVQNGSGAHPDSYLMGSRGSFTGVKRSGREAYHSPPSSAYVKNAWSYTSTPQYALMAWCSVTRSTRTTLPLPF